MQGSADSATRLVETNPLASAAAHAFQIPEATHYC